MAGLGIFDQRHSRLKQECNDTIILVHSVIVCDTQSDKLPYLLFIYF